MRVELLGLKKYLIPCIGGVLYGLIFIYGDGFYVGLAPLIGLVMILVLIREKMSPMPQVGLLHYVKNEPGENCLWHGGEYIVLHVNRRTFGAG